MLNLWCSSSMAANLLLITYLVVNYIKTGQSFNHPAVIHVYSMTIARNKILSGRSSYSRTLKLFSTIGDSHEEEGGGSDYEERRKSKNRGRRRQHMQSSRIEDLSTAARNRNRKLDPTSLIQSNDKSALWDDWGVEQQQQRSSSLPPFEDSAVGFPDTYDEVSDLIVDTILAVLHNKQKLDPNVASNARAKSIYDYRPTHKNSAERIGIEVDNPSLLSSPGPSRRDHSSDGYALRKLALMMASKLSSSSDKWELYKGNKIKNGGRQQKYRRIAIYFNTIKQALLASKELRMLKRMAENDSNYDEINDMKEIYKLIDILYLGQEDDVDIPKEMCRKRPSERKLSRSKRKYKDSTNEEDAVEEHDDDPLGLVIVVQPTDYNNEFRPPGPAVGIISSMQKLMIRASVEQLPMVLLSPRFMQSNVADNAGEDGRMLLGNISNNGGDQSGYQRSSTYGGSEPPLGPTPWFMRDFTPPSFVWVGNALSFTPEQQAFHQKLLSSSRSKTDYSKYGGKKNFYYSSYPRITLLQSVMHDGHSWHIYAANDYIELTKMKNQKKMAASLKRSDYEYIASTKTSSGRPTKNILNQIFQLWLEEKY